MEDRSQTQAAGLGRETLEGVRNGDPAARTVFFEYCFDRVYSLALRLTGDRTTAEDVTQEVFLKILQAADRLDPDRDPLPWVTVITYNVCRDRWRTREHKVSRDSVPIDDPSGGREIASPAPDPESGVLAGERERAVEAALLQLPEEFRAVVLLRDYCGLRHSRIAELTGDSEAAVRKRYSRALSRLAEQLKGFWNE